MTYGISNYNSKQQPTSTGKMTVSSSVNVDVYTHIEAIAQKEGSSKSAVAGRILSDWYRKQIENPPADVGAP